jgi:8-oxo-dGTP pyrophosphatase MutT (NUDIX family)
LIDNDEPIPAATLVLMRPAAGAPELLMIERTATMAFAAGALVFPGGRIDPDDYLLAERIGGGVEHGAARIAAVRETIEETGIAPVLAKPIDPAAIAQIRRELEDGVPFSTLVKTYDLRLELSKLIPFARWCPNFKEARRFDTLFFVAEAPRDTVAIVAQAEAVRSLWATAAQILDDVSAGRARAIFPTRRNLERLARFRSLKEAGADAALHPVRKVVPWIEGRDGARWLCIPDDLGYPITAELLESARRF